jgi:zinc D-Ala-D-Ala carboxypeptidase
MKDTSHRQPARTAARRTGSTILAAALIIGAALTGIAISPVALLRGNLEAAVIGIPPIQKEDRGQHEDRDRRAERQTPAPPLGEADGVVPDGVTVFDEETRAVVNLDPDLLGALRQAATDAADDGVEFSVNSGWRSPAYQDQLLHEAISQYGSEEEAARWVATAETSAHVSGDAVDIGPPDAAAWLSKHGAEYGLCQIYGNEPWHYELRLEAINHGCPPMYADPTQDPRMRR